jgi:4,5-dihydroxyphthalate decarboxylase
LLRDCGVQPQDIEWKVGEGDDPKLPEFPAGRAPEGVDIKVLPPGRTLESRLLSGELDAIISLHIPESAKSSDGRIRTLFPDPAAAERAWFETSRIFPIMHAVGVRKSVAEEHPSLTRELYDVFLAAKNLAVAELEIVQAPKVTLPWPHKALAEARSLIGPDPWPYGLSVNRHVLEAQLQWSLADGLQARAVTVEDLFAPDCYDT